MTKKGKKVSRILERWNEKISRNFGRFLYVESL